MGNLYLHIGIPKTGTSAIQVFLGKNRPALKKKGYCFPDFNQSFPGIGQNRNAHFLICHIKDGKKKQDTEQEEQVREKAFAQLFEELHKYNHVILSDEGIWNNFESIPDFWENLHDRITKEGHTLQVIVYLRRQDMFVQSYWAQQVKETCTDSFQEYMEKEKYAKCHLHYAEALDQIGSVIGKENIHVRVYEKAQYYKESLVADFLHAVGLELDEDFVSPDLTANASITGRSLEIKRILNSVPEFKKKKNYLVQYLLEVKQEDAKGFDRAACFPPGKQQEFLAKYEAGNQRVAKDYLDRQDGVLFREPMQSCEGIAEEYTKEELVLACGEIFSMMHKKLKKQREPADNMKKVFQKVRKTLKKS